MTIFQWVMLIWLAGQDGFQYAGPFSSQTGCHIASIQVQAYDERITRVQCIPWDDPAPGNIG